MPAKQAYLYFIIIIIFNKQSFMPTEGRNEWELSEVDIKASHEKYVYWVTTTELPFCSPEKKKMQAETNRKVYNHYVKGNKTTLR